MKHCLSLIFVLILMVGCTATPIQSDTATIPAPANNNLTDTPAPINEVPTGWISFDSKQDGVWGIYLIKVDGSDKAQPLTVHQKGEYWSTWSPDGKKIAFSSFRDSTDSSATSAIYIINTDGTGLKQVTDSVAKDSMPAWSPNGKEIAFSSDRDAGNTDVYVVNSDGTDLRRLTQDPAGDIWPSWSPDGKRIAFISQRSGNWQVHIMNADGGNVTQLTEGSVNANSAWSPDGKQIAFVSGRDGTQDIYVMDIDGGNVKRLTNDPDKDDYPTWSPDGQFIAFVTDHAGNRDIYIMRKDGSDVTRITDEPTDEYPPKWSPANVMVNAEPRFGFPYCLRDTDNDGIADTATKEFLQSDSAFFVSFPYDNMSKDLAWSVLLVHENEAYTPISYSASWSEEASGIMTLRLGNMTGYEITGPIRGAGIGPVPPGSMKVQLFIEDNLIQEVECEIVPSK